MFARGLHVAFLLGSHVAGFSLYPTVNPDSLAKSFGISVNCLDALNTTVACDQDLFGWANSVDDYWWSESNVTDLCTSDCTASAQQWNDDVQQRCTDENIVVYGKMAPADSVAGRYFDGLSIACTQPDSTLNSTDSNPGGWNSSSASNSVRNTSSSVSLKASSNATSWCLLQSQEWVGSDVIRPNCDNNATDPSCSDPADTSAENERIANLYDNTVLCSDCFLKMYYNRIASPYLPDVDYSDYLVAQFQDIIDVCNATMPNLVIRAPPDYQGVPSPAPGLTFGTNNTSTNTSSSGPFNGNATASTCPGQIIQPGINLKSCDDYSRKYGVTTGDLQAVTEGDECTVKNPICLPAACTVKKVSANATCDLLSTSFSTTTLKITTFQFLTWNPNINGLCDNLKQGDYVCASPPGGFYVAPPAPVGLANASAQERGGGDGSDTSNTNLTATPATSTSVSPSHPALSSASPVPATTSSAVGSGGNPADAKPSPTQTGISPACTKYEQAKEGDYCSKFAQDNGITTDDLYSWNSALGSGGSNCDKSFWLGYYYCIGVGK